MWYWLRLIFTQMEGRSLPLGDSSDLFATFLIRVREMYSVVIQTPRQQHRSDDLSAREEIPDVFLHFIKSISMHSLETGERFSANACLDMLGE